MIQVKELHQIQQQEKCAYSTLACCVTQSSVSKGEINVYHMTNKLFDYYNHEYSLIFCIQLNRFIKFKAWLKNHKILDKQLFKQLFCINTWQCFDIISTTFQWLSFQMVNQNVRTMRGGVVRLHICALTIDICAFRYSCNLICQVATVWWSLR